MLINLIGQADEQGSETRRGKWKPLLRIQYTTEYPVDCSLTTACYQQNRSILTRMVECSLLFPQIARTRPPFKAGTSLPSPLPFPFPYTFAYTYLS